MHRAIPKPLEPRPVPPYIQIRYVMYLGSASTRHRQRTSPSMSSQLSSRSSVAPANLATSRALLARQSTAHPLAHAKYSPSSRLGRALDAHHLPSPHAVVASDRVRHHDTWELRVLQAAGVSALLGEDASVAGEEADADGRDDVERRTRRVSSPRTQSVAAGDATPTSTGILPPSPTH